MHDLEVCQIAHGGEVARMNTQTRLNAMELTVLDAARSVQQSGVQVCKNLSQLNVSSKGIGPQRSLEAEDIGEFPTFGVMQRLAKIEVDKAEKEIFSLKQRLAALKKADPY
jgi:hypothetical protein